MRLQCSRLSLDSAKRVKMTAYTLMEILLAICILVVLAVLLMPALQLARTTSLRMQGLTNMRQTMSAILLYAADHDNKLPGPLDEFHYPVVTTKTDQLVYYIGNYLGVPAGAGVGWVVAPMAPAAFLSKYDPKKKACYFAINNIYLPTTGSKNISIKPWGTLDQKSGYTEADHTPKAITVIPTPSETVAIIDADSKLRSTLGPMGDRSYLIKEPSYGNLRNAGFFDGHVESVPIDYNMFPYYK